MGPQHTALLGLLHAGRRHRREDRRSSRAARGPWARVPSETPGELEASASRPGRRRLQPSAMLDACSCKPTASNVIFLSLLHSKKA
eukprot:3786572-Pyramimonas_sp.AAC.1